MGWSVGSLGSILEGPSESVKSHGGEDLRKRGNQSCYHADGFLDLAVLWSDLRTSPF